MKRYKIQLANKDWFFIIDEEMFKTIVPKAGRFNSDVWWIKDVENIEYIISGKNIAWVQVYEKV